MTKFFRFCTLILLISAPVSAQEIHGVYIANQGNFSDGNASITRYDLSTRQAEQVLSNFGTIVQSITLHGNFGYIASNTSNNVDILDLSTNMRVGQIREVASPRYISVVGQDKAYVSEQLDPGKVKVLNLQSRTVSGSVDTGSRPEDIAVAGSRAFVANSGWGSDSTLTVIDTRTDTVIETIDLGCDGPRHLEVDQQGDLWAFCTGKTVWNSDFTQIVDRTNGAAVVLNPQTGDILNRIEFSHQVGSSGPGQDSHYSAESEEIFLIRSDSAMVLVFDATTNMYKESIPFSGTESVGGLAYDATERLFYIGRFDSNPLIGFTQPGFVQIANRDDLSEVGRFTAGIAPAHVVLHKSPQATAVDEIGVPQVVSLSPAYPNPFNESTTLTFVLERAQQVSLVIYDALGREVAHPVSGLRSAGEHRVVWEAGQLPMGAYFSRLMVDGQIAATGTLVRTR
ncbi:MAG: T9SS type A sorting domain-containing protein [Bacteroidota bacterium]|nr:T9SS type A sorting domain-containing protein [Bacteroidota bacterium]MXW13610.1 T9SS type A sorting domain-containing protein [Rhodothermaceae bacterium]MDE2646227.1 T9SS type A sorting domain-containing protein [Bacteroidota bacterium]MXW32441.1 T9SS type A sorting domain-containing protein [Rhodothermaceae bacterium]MXZ18496.1 T9SS type A sorting domain-containing protein [Rhodothermaceae bacterium]